MYRAVGMGNWLTDLMGGRVQLPPMSMRIDLPGGVALSQPTAAPGATQPVTRSGVGDIATWAIPIGVAAVVGMFLFRSRSR